MKRLLSLTLLILLLTGCHRRPDAAKNKANETKVSLSYAKGFDIAHTETYTAVTVYNPWKSGEIYDKYYLVKKQEINVPADGQKIVVPLKTLMANSATHLGFLELLDELDKVTGICSTQYIYNPSILQGVEEGRVKDLGDAFNLDIENLLLLRPQAVMTSAYNVDDENSRKMKQTGIPILYNIEWQEPSILGRAEWIKYVAAFFDKEAEADSIFEEVTEKYNRLKEKAAAFSGEPAIFSGEDYRGTWSMPGGKSYLAQLFRDAGATYLYSRDSVSASIPLNIEKALIDFSEADIWVGVKARSLDELKKTNSKYKLFKAFKTGQVYNMGKRMNATGGNDYWESGVARPNLLLKDMIKICHPQQTEEYESTYFEQLK